MKLRNPGVETGKVSSEKQTAMCYDAPEVSDGKKELKSDVWSLGVTLMELVKKKNPYEDTGEFEADDYYFSDYPPYLSKEKWSVMCVDFARKCLVRGDGTSRP